MTSQSTRFVYFTGGAAGVTLPVMTPFMESVLVVARGSAAPRATTAQRRPEAPLDAVGAHVLVRATAEQLVSEANAALGDPDGPVGHLGLVDECRPGALAFILTYGMRAASVRTVLHSDSPGPVAVVGACEPRRVTTAEDVQALVLSLVAED